MGTKLGRWDMAFARKVGMRNKVCGPKDTYIKTNLGRRDVAFTRKVGMKNKVCGREGHLHENKAGSTGRDMRSKNWYEK